MKAIVRADYGPPEVLRLSEIERPTPGPDEVLVGVRAASVNPIDWHFMRGIPFAVRLQSGLRRPRDRRLGYDVAGRVEAAGRNVTRFKAGDEVFGSCKGAFAEFACAPESALASKPPNLTFEEAAAVPVAGLSALQALRDKGGIRPGQRVLINGASGGVGTFAVQLAKGFGAQVTGVCSSRNVDMVRAIGADHVVDYTQEDFTRAGLRYDLILDTVGNHSLSDRRRALTQAGALVMVGGSETGRWLGPLAGMLKAVALSPFVSQRLLPFMARLNRDDLVALQELVGAGRVVPVIDRTYPLGEVPQAIRHLEGGHARGKIVITMAGPGRG
jgi:NADPH:quinone reductase-like Zn-dependent oxidoreductase